jgi:hypothetical protein
MAARLPYYGPMNRSLVLALVVLAGCTQSKPPEQAVQAEYVDPVLAARAQSLLGVSLPCTLITAVTYLDGGVAGGSLGGAKGEVLKFAFGSTLNPPAAPMDTSFYPATGELVVDTLSTTKQYQAFVGADYPTKTGATPLGMGTAAESVFIDVLRAAVVRERKGSTDPHRNSGAATAASIVTILERQRSHPRGIIQ